MTIDKVRPIREGVTTSERKQQFLDHVAATYDRVTDADGREPVCIVFALVGESGTGQSGYASHPSIDHFNVLHISRGVMCLNLDYAHWDKEATSAK